MQNNLEIIGYVNLSKPSDEKNLHRKFQNQQCQVHQWSEHALSQFQVFRYTFWQGRWRDDQRDPLPKHQHCHESSQHSGPWLQSQCRPWSLAYRSWCRATQSQLQEVRQQFGQPEEEMIIHKVE